MKIKGVLLVIIIFVSLVVGFAGGMLTSKFFYSNQPVAIGEEAADNSTIFVTNTIGDENNQNNQSQKKIVAVAKKDGYLCFIDDKLNAERMYKIPEQAKLIVRDRNVYVMVEGSSGDTSYVDVINIDNSNSARTFVISELEGNTTSEDYNVYYYKDNVLYCRNLKTGKEEVDNKDNIKKDYLYSLNKMDKVLSRKNLTTNQEETMYTYNEICYDFIVGENKIYHCGDDNFFYSDLDTKNVTIIGKDLNSTTGHGVEGRIVEYDATTYVYTDEAKVYVVEDGIAEKQAIYEITDDGKISDISFINNDVLQISVRHLGGGGTSNVYPNIDGGICWRTDEWHYYDLKTKQFVNPSEKGFEDIIVLDK